MQTSATRVGNDYAHAIVDDHARLAYVELHDDERAATVTACLERALAFFAGHGMADARRLDRLGNAFTLRRTARCASCSPQHSDATTSERRPPNGTPHATARVERFHQRPWASDSAHGRSYAPA